MFPWLAVVLVVETARLYVPVVSRTLVGLFEGLIRETAVELKLCTGEQFDQWVKPEAMVGKL